MRYNPVLNPSELERLASERLEQTVEHFTPNDFYGAATVLKAYCGLAQDFVLNAIMPHGPSFCSKLWDTELNHPIPTVLAISDQQRALYEQQCGKKVYVIGSPLYYAARRIESELSEIRQGAAGTVVFPTHSTHHVTVQFDEAQFIDYLQRLPPEFRPVHVCLYWRDVQLGRHRIYCEAGLECTTAGHMFDKEFLFRVLRILTAHRFAAINKLGSSALYAAALGLPVSIFRQEATYGGERLEFLKELSPRLDLPVAVKFYETAALPLEQAGDAQRPLAEEALGLSHVKEPAELRALLEGLCFGRSLSPPQEPEGRSTPHPSPLLVRGGEGEEERLAVQGDQARNIVSGGFHPGPGPKERERPCPLLAKNERVRKHAGTEERLEDSIRGVLDGLRMNLAQHPRRVPGRLQLAGRPFAYADLHSFYYQAEQIFAQRLYEFTSSNDRPFILDCGAHVGLAALYFARRFPKATIHAFEADPAIARLLAENVSSLDLGQVIVHAEAVWTSQDAVGFAATADDSGHVRPDSVNRVPSIRLRDWLLGQPVDLLKLDIEGAEFSVIKDCDGALANVRHLVMEAHQFRDGEGRLGELLSVLERNGFEYALGDLHAADWIQSSFRPPLAACRTKHYIVTVFAWQKVPAQASHRAAPGELPASRVFVHDALERLNRGENAQALSLFDEAARLGQCCPRLQFGRSLALARLDRTEEACAALRIARSQDPTLVKTHLLLEELSPKHELSHFAKCEKPALIYIASYPRSGNTWMRMLLADVIEQALGLKTGTQLPIHADHVIPDLHVSSLEAVDPRVHLSRPLAKSHDPWDKLQGEAVYLFRQPADALVSYFHFHRRYKHLAATAADGLEAFCRRKLGDWSQHVESFLGGARALRRVLFVSYEKLHEDPVAVLAAVTSFIGLSASRQTCETAVANHRFENHRGAERLGENHAEFFFRRGEVNGANQELPSEVLLFINQTAMPLYQRAKDLEAQGLAAGVLTF